MKELGLKKSLKVTYEEALARIPEALKAEGFGVLTEIDVAATLKAKIDVDFRKYKILGACNPPIAHRALSTDLMVGLMMPCNVVVYEGDDKKAVVMAVDPTLTVAASGSPELGALADDIKARLSRALAKLD